MGAFKSGEWLPNLVRAAFKAYYENANPEYLRRKYRRASDKRIIGKLTKIAARNAAIVGGITGAAVSVDEILALIASAPTGELNLPTQITAAATALECEAVALIRIQSHLVAQIAKLLSRNNANRWNRYKPFPQWSQTTPTASAEKVIRHSPNF